MSARFSTLRLAAHSTIEQGRDVPSPPRPGDIRAYWRAHGEAGVLAAIDAFPALAQEKSLLLDLVLEEFKARRHQSPDLPIQQFSERFRGLGNSLEQSIFRLLEVQEYLENHPELLDLVEGFQWPEPDDDLEGFRVLEELGRGAVARVYLCEEAGVGGRAVVLKVARGGDYEAALMGRLDHPNIVPIYSVVNDPQRRVSYICMPFRGRSTLQDVVDIGFANGIPRHATVIRDAAQHWLQPTDREHARGTIATPRVAFLHGYVDGVVQLAAKIVAALAHAHDRGILHGDLKPSNVLLTPGGEPLLIDFNLARDRQAEAGPRGGTLPYMAPEQLRAVVDDSAAGAVPYRTSSEVYSFGALMYQLLTGEVPFPIPTGALEAKKLSGSLLSAQRSRPPRIRARNRWVNAELDELVLQCLAWNPDDRPQSMEELARRLQSQQRPRVRIQQMALTHPRIARLLVLLAISIGIGLAGYLTLRPPAHVRHFNRGIALQQRHEYRSAIDFFDQALEASPQFYDALYERARTHMLNQRYSEAINDFSKVVVNDQNVQAAAYAGYCFNKKQEPSAAIIWYERALDMGFETAGLRNNLGISFQMTRAGIDRLAKAEHHLHRAAELDPTSMTIRSNLIELAITRSSQEPAYNPAHALEHLDVEIEASPNSPKVWVHATLLLGELSRDSPEYLDRGLESLRTAIRLGGGPSARVLSSSPLYEIYRGHQRFADVYREAEEVTPSPIISTGSRLIDPVAGSPGDLVTQR